MSKLFKLLLAAAVASLTVACSTKELDGVNERLNDLESRVSELERLCKEMNNNISSLQSIVTAMQTGDYITSVTPITSGDKTVGYTITFAKGQPITIYHGEDGKDGKDGKDGAKGQDGQDGTDGHTPVIGVKQDTDGIWYWTLDGEWLLDANGQKVKAVGVDGKDGADGNDGTNGQDGKDGADGVTPQLKIEDGYWYVSTDKGQTWTQLGKATGENGQDGTNGTDGKDGDSMFQSVTVTDTEVTFVTSDGQTFVVQRAAALSIEFDSADLVVMGTNATRDIHYTITSGIDDITIEALSSADIKVKVVKTDAKTGSLNVKTSATIDEYSKVVVLVNNGSQAIMRTLNFEEEAIEVEENTTKEVTDNGGEVALEFFSNTPCHAVIPEEAQSWISVAPETKALEKQSISLILQPNDGAARNATVIVTSEEGTLVLSYMIEQGPNHDYQLAIEKDALMAIYYSVSAESQAKMTGWGTDEPLSSWYGITLSDNGYVENLRLFDIDFVKSMPAEIGNIKYLKELFIYGTNLSGTYGKDGCYLAPEIGNLSKLESLHIQRQDFVGDIPVELAQLNNLKTLVIEETGINGTIPPEICTLENLEVLGLQFNPLTGTIPPEIGQLKNLRCLYLHGKESNLSGSIPVELCSLTKLEELYLGAKLSGTIPHEIGQLTNLKSFTINWSSITGEIPEEIGNLSNLVSLQIDDSPITGSLPRSLVNCKKLENLFIEACPITGPLPTWISEMKSLKRLSFYMTNMSGMIPKEWAQCHLLYDINLSRCPYLYGSIPEEVMEMNAFKYRWGNWVNGTNFNLIGVKIPAPDFNVTSLDGVNINSAEQYANNKFTILFQWNYWCPSITETPTLVNLYNKYHEKGLNVIGWSDDDAPEYFEHPHPMSETIAQYGMPWQNFVVPAGEREGYGVFGNMINKYPGDIAGAIALVNDEGYIIWSNLYDSMENLTKIIDDYYEGEDPNIYHSVDFSADGVVLQLQTATVGDGINVVLMGDGFTDQLIADGTYHGVINKMKEAFFQEEPYASYQPYFNVYEVDVVSQNETKDNGNTALRTWFGEGTQVGGNNSICIDYALKAIDAKQMDDAIIIVAINSPAYAGTCYMYNIVEGDYGKGLSVAYFPIGEDDSQIANLVHHEAGGHGFAKLADEYAYEYMGAISADAIANTRTMEPYGWWKNVDFTSDPATVKWAPFIADERYASEGIGCYEGGLTYWTGVWRPTDASIMRYNTGGFNAPSRYAIWYRIGKLAYGESWEGSYEDFVAYDAVNRTPAAIQRRSAQRRNYVQKPLPQLPPPVVVGHSWREELQKK